VFREILEQVVRQQTLAAQLTHPHGPPMTMGNMCEQAALALLSNVPKC
jgi:hypothetical protein